MFFYKRVPRFPNMQIKRKYLHVQSCFFKSKSQGGHCDVTGKGNCPKMALFILFISGWRMMIIQPEHINDICYIHFLEITIIISYNHSHINDRWMVYVHMVFFVDWGFNHPCIQWTRCDEWLPHRPEPPGGPTSWRWTQNWLVNSTCIVVFSISHIIYIYIYTVYMIIYIYICT